MKNSQKKLKLFSKIKIQCLRLNKQDVARRASETLNQKPQQNKKEEEDYSNYIIDPVLCLMCFMFQVTFVVVVLLLLILNGQ